MHSLRGLRTKTSHTFLEHVLNKCAGSRAATAHSTQSEHHRHRYTACRAYTRKYILTSSKHETRARPTTHRRNNTRVHKMQHNRTAAAQWGGGLLIDGERALCGHRVQVCRRALRLRVKCRVVCCFRSEQPQTNSNCGRFFPSFSFRNQVLGTLNSRASTPRTIFGDFACGKLMSRYGIVISVFHWTGEKRAAVSGRRVMFT